MQFSFSANSEQIDFIPNTYLDFKVVDEEGNELVSHSGASRMQKVDGREYYTGDRLIEPIKDKKLTVTPYMTFSQIVTSVEVDLEGNETEVKTKTFEGSDIEFESFTVTIP